VDIVYELPETVVAVEPHLAAFDSVVLERHEGSVRIHEGLFVFSRHLLALEHLLLEEVDVDLVPT